MPKVTVRYIEELEAVESNSTRAADIVAKRVGDALTSPSSVPFSHPEYVEAMALLLAHFKDESPPLIEPLLATVVPEYIRARDHFRFLRLMQRAISSYRTGRDAYELMLRVVDQIRVSTL